MPRQLKIIGDHPAEGMPAILSRTTEDLVQREVVAGHPRLAAVDTLARGEYGAAELYANEELVAVAIASGLYAGARLRVLWPDADAFEDLA